jgi:hypothetical protein
MFLFRNLELGGLEVPILQTRAIVMTLANTVEVEAMNALLPFLFLISLLRLHSSHFALLYFMPL